MLVNWLPTPLWCSIKTSYISDLSRKCTIDVQRMHCLKNKEKRENKMPQRLEVSCEPLSVWDERQRLSRSDTYWGASLGFSNIFWWSFAILSALAGHLHWKPWTVGAKMTKCREFVFLMDGVFLSFSLNLSLKHLLITFAIISHIEVA